MEKRVQIGLKLPPSLVERIDLAREELPVRADRTALIEKAIEEWLDRHERADNSRGKGRAKR